MRPTVRRDCAERASRLVKDIPRVSDYEVIKVMREVAVLCAGSITDDIMIELFDSVAESCALWIDNYDPTPYEAEVK